MSSTAGNDHDNGGTIDTVQSRLYVIAAPSGAGKTSIVRALLERESNTRFSISYTTRKQRETEERDKDYIFVDKDEFLTMAGNGDFLEYAQVFDHYYSTGKAEVQALLGQGYDVLLEIDWQGAQQVRDAMPEAVTIFILPPTVAELERRLRGRRTDSDDVIARRLRDSLSDLGHWAEFEYVVINDDFETAISDMRTIIAGGGDTHKSSDENIRRFAASLLIDPA